MAYARLIDNFTKALAEYIAYGEIIDIYQAAGIPSSRLVDLEAEFQTRAKAAHLCRGHR